MKKKQNQKQIKIFRENETKIHFQKGPLTIRINAMMLGYNRENVQRLYHIYLEMDA